MAKALDNLDKRINSILTALILVIAAYFGFTLSQELNQTELDQSVEVLGITQSIDSVQDNQNRAQLKISNPGNGTSIIYLQFDQPTKVTGGELYFEISGDLDITSLKCSPHFRCVSTSFTDEVLVLRPIRDQEMIKQPLSNSISIAEINYDQSTEGSLIMNSEEVKESIILQLDQTHNLLRPQKLSFEINR